MSSLLHVADYVVIGIMMVISAAVGIYFRFTGGRQKTMLEYLMADKSMTVLPVTFSILATLMSAITVLGTPTETYLYGTQIWMREFFYPGAVLIVAHQIIPVYFENDVRTIYEYLEKRFGKVMMITVSLFYLAQMIFYMPVTIYAPSLAINLLTGISLWTSVITVTIVCTFYSSLGGLKAVLWADVFQAMVMLLAVFILIIKSSVDFGGLYNVYKTAEEGQRLEFFNTSIDFTVRYTFWNTMAQGIILGLYLNSSMFSIVQRLLSCGSVKKAQRSLLWSIPLIFICQTSLCFLGTNMYAYFHDCDPLSDKAIASGDQLLPLLAMKLFENIPGLPGVCVAGILSASLSTMSSVLNSLVAVTLEDYIKPFMKCGNLKDSTATLLAKSLAVFYGGFCLFLTFVVANVKGLLETSLLILGIVGGPTFGVFFLGMFTTTVGESGALIGFVAGVAMGGWIGFGSLYSKSKYPPYPLSTEGCASHANYTSLDSMYVANFTLAPEVFNVTSSFNATHEEEERYINPLYKTSYLWMTTINFLCTAVVGYAISLIVGLYRPNKEVDPKYLSPIARKWLCKAPELHTSKEYIKLPQVLNQTEENPNQQNNDVIKFDETL